MEKVTEILGQILVVLQEIKVVLESIDEGIWYDEDDYEDEVEPSEETAKKD